MENNQGILILGATGLIGNHLYNFLKKTGKKVIGTYNKDKQESLFYFDITKSSLDELPLSNISYAVICSAITKLDDCRDNPEYSHKVNVESTEKLIIELSRRGIVPVFLSSGAVFDGALGGYKEDSPRNPLSIYGEQKLEVEDYTINELYTNSDGEESLDIWAECQNPECMAKYFTFIPTTDFILTK